MNMTNALERIDMNLLKAAEKIYLLKLNTNDKYKLIAAIADIKEALSLAENLEGGIYEQDIDE